MKIPTKITTPAALESVVVPMVLRSTGDGDPSIPDKTTAKTAKHLPDLLTRTVSQTAVLVARFGDKFFVTLSSLMSVAGLGNVTGVGPTVLQGDFGQIAGGALWLAFAVAFGGLLKDLGALFGGWATKYPLLSGSIGNI